MGGGLHYLLFKSLHGRSDLLSIQGEIPDCLRECYLGLVMFIFKGYTLLNQVVLGPGHWAHIKGVGGTIPADLHAASGTMPLSQGTGLIQQVLTEKLSVQS